MGPVETLSPEILKRKYIVHNSQLTLVRLSREELQRTAMIMADRLNMAKGPTHVFIPLEGFFISRPSRAGTLGSRRQRVVYPHIEIAPFFFDTV